MSREALQGNRPTLGFNNRNTYHNSCGPDASLNMLRWYGIEQISGVTAHILGEEMDTNDWTIFGLPGTKTSRLKNTTQSWLERYFPNNAPEAPYHVVRGEADPIFGATAYINIATALEAGNPVLVVYKSGDWEMHHALIVGLESRGGPSINDDKVYIANIRAENVDDDGMTWGRFVQRWERDYPLGGDAVLEAADEDEYEWLFAARTDFANGVHLHIRDECDIDLIGFEANCWYNVYDVLLRRNDRRRMAGDLSVID